jgi:hypothetical protein
MERLHSQNAAAGLLKKTTVIIGLRPEKSAVSKTSK